VDGPDRDSLVRRSGLLDGEDLDDVASLEDRVSHGSEGREPLRAAAGE